MQKDVVLTPDIGLMLPLQWFCSAGFCFTPVVTSVWLQCEECICLDLNVGNNLSVDFFNKH